MHLALYSYSNRSWLVNGMVENSMNRCKAHEELEVQSEGTSG